MDREGRGGDLSGENRRVFIDELNQIRLVDPVQLESSNKLATQGKQFIGQFEQFLQTIQEVRESIEKIGRIADRERLKMLSLQNELENRRRNEFTASEEGQQIQILINERQKELERLRVEFQSLKEVEAQQNEYSAMCRKI